MGNNLEIIGLVDYIDETSSVMNENLVCFIQFEITVAFIKSLEPMIHIMLLPEQQYIYSIGVQLVEYILIRYYKTANVASNKSQISIVIFLKCIHPYSIHYFT